MERKGKAALRVRSEAAMTAALEALRAGRRAQAAFVQSCLAEAEAERAAARESSAARKSYIGCTEKGD